VPSTREGLDHHGHRPRVQVRCIIALRHRSDYFLCPDNPRRLINHQGTLRPSAPFFVVSLGRYHNFSQIQRKRYHKESPKCYMIRKWMMVSRESYITRRQENDMVGHQGITSFRPPPPLNKAFISNSFPRDISATHHPVTSLRTTR
jgi:hypothetical protein